MKKLLSLSLMFSLGLATVTPTLNAVAESQQDVVAQSQANPANVSGWQAAKKWWQSGRNMKALNRQEKKAFKALKRKFAIGAIIASIVPAAMAVYLDRMLAAEYALEEAIRKGDEAEVTRLIAAGADVNAADRYGDTALMHAAREGHENIVNLLLDAGADVNAAGPGGFTALMMAAYGGHTDMVEKLLDAGADKRAANIIARTRGYEELANFIRDYVRSGRTVKRAVTGPDKNYM